LRGIKDMFLPEDYWGLIIKGELENG